MKHPALILLAAGAALLSSCSASKPEAEKAPAGQRPDSALIEMKPEAQRHVGLKVAPASATHLREYLQVTGTVQPVDSRMAEVRPLGRGRLQQVLVRVGDRVTRGQALARYDNVEAGELVAQHEAGLAELQRLKVQHAAAARQAARNWRLAEIGAVPQKEVEASQAEEESLRESVRSQESVIAGIAGRLRRLGITQPGQAGSATTVESAIAGVVIKVQAAPGEVIDTDKQLFLIADLTQVWVQAEVYEKDLGRVRIGQPAFIKVDTYPDEEFTGKVTYISDVLDPQTRTAKVRCELSNRAMRLKLDMFATVRLPTTFNRQAITVPASTIQRVDSKDVVFVQRAPSRFEAREVATGKTVGGLTEIARGLAAGEPVVVQGAFHLKSILLGKELAEEK